MARRKASSINLILGVDKPVGCTSHDVVARIRRAVGERRVGHAGTLDPLASGVMVVGIGQGTRLLGMLTLDTKSYLAKISFGFETNTDDSEGEPSRRADVPKTLLDASFAQSALDAFKGTSFQVPPSFSAISVNGVRSYKRARAGDEVELPARQVEVYEAALLGIESEGGGVTWSCAFTVSKGTYIRALARDLGRAVSSAAHLSGLRRTASGCITLASCAQLDGLDADAARENAIDPVSALGIGSVDVPVERLDDILCGRRIACASLPGWMASVPSDAAEGDSVALVVRGELRAIARIDAGSLVMKAVFPEGIGGVHR